MGQKISSESINKQESYVNKEYSKVSTSAKSMGYNEYQIKGKIRNEYHNRANNSDYITSSDWSKLRTNSKYS
jgi:hypothetical protein